MKRPLTLARFAAVLALLGGSYAVADRGDGTEIAYAVQNDDLVEILSGVDYVPLIGDFDELLENGAEDLIAIARDSGEKPGLRIRAYRALALYPGLDTEEALKNAIGDHSDDGQVALASTGVDTIMLRAAMDSFAVIARSGAVSHISPMLRHDSRDVRAAAARALAVCGALSAVQPLRVQLSQETVPQVRWALEEAIRVLMGDGSADP